MRVLNYKSFNHGIAIKIQFYPYVFLYLNINKDKRLWRFIFSQLLFGMEIYTFLWILLSSSSFSNNTVLILVPQHPEGREKSLKFWALKDHWYYNQD